MKYNGKEYEAVKGRCPDDCDFRNSGECSKVCKGYGFVLKEVKPTTEQTAATETDKPNLCDTCKNSSCCTLCVNGIVKNCSHYEAIATDKSHKEQAEREIVQILEQLNGQLEMRIAGVVVFSKELDGKLYYKPTVEILLK